MVAMVVMASLHITSWAQTPLPERTSTLSGFVRDSSDGELLPNAAVAIAVGNRTMGALSNAEGYYAIPDIPAGTWVVTASYIGYATRQDTLALTGQGLRWDIELERQALEMREVVVEAAGERGERTESAAERGRLASNGCATDGGHGRAGPTAQFATAAGCASGIGF